MSNQITRRDILKFTGGGILGLMLSPLPWKLLDDSAIWTQNWSLTPKLSHGPITSVFSHCTLCNSGCAVKAECVSGMPYFLSGVHNHPFTHGTLCVRGIASHHMAYHPLRIVQPHTFAGKSDTSTMTAVSLQEALEAVANKIHNAKGSIAILDHQPERAISELYRKFLSKLQNGIYVTSPSCENATLDALRKMTQQKDELFGFDFENTKLILSFGAPLLDGWGIPGRMTALRNQHNVKLIQIDHRYSRTAMQADEWVPIKPGTEKILALTIAHALIDQNLIPKQVSASVIDFSQLKSTVKNFTAEKTADVTDIHPDVVKKIAYDIAKSGSAIVLSGADAGSGPFDDETEKAIALLNVLIGNVGKTGGIVARKNIPGYRTTSPISQWTKIPDHSISVLIVDDADSGYAIPWRLIEQKLIPGNDCVISFSSTLNEISAHADYLIPAPAHFETLRDVPNTAGINVASFALSSPLLKKQEGTVEPLDVIREISHRLNISLDIPSHEEILKSKVQAMHSQKRGSLFVYSNQHSIPVSDIASPEELWIKLLEGGMWIDEPLRQTQQRKFTMQISSDQPAMTKTSDLQMIPYGWKGATSTAQISPILSKVFQETELRENNGTVRINPVTAHQLGLTANGVATLSTKNGSTMVRVKISNSVRPDIVEAAVAPLPNGVETPSQPAGNTILNLCEISGDGTWKMTPANLLKV
jgi:anaerobic selenocysteine-containing dehydrogenase